MCSRSLKRRLCSLEPLKMSLTISSTFSSSFSSSLVSLRKEISTLRSLGNPLARRQHMDHKHKRRWRLSLTNASIQDHQSHFCWRSSSFLETLPSSLQTPPVQSHVSKHSQRLVLECILFSQVIAFLSAHVSAGVQISPSETRTFEKCICARAPAIKWKLANWICAHVLVKTKKKTQKQKWYLHTSLCKHSKIKNAISTETLAKNLNLKASREIKWNVLQFYKQQEDVQGLT